MLLYWGYHNLTTATIKIHSKYITTEKYSFFSLRKNHYNKQEIIVVLKIFTNFNLKVFEIILKGIWRKRPCFEKIFGWVLNHTRWSLGLVKQIWPILLHILFCQWLPFSSRQSVFSKKFCLPRKQAASFKKIRIRLEKSLTPHCNNVQSSFSARISTLPCGGEKETQFFPPSEIIIARKTLHKFFKFRRKLGTNSAKLTMSKTKTNTKGSEKKKYYRCGQIT